MMCLSIAYGSSICFDNIHHSTKGFFENSCNYPKLTLLLFKLYANESNYPTTFIE